MTSDAPTVGVVAAAGVTPFELAPHNCFACGALNAHGLRLVLHVERGRAWTELTLAESFEGWAGIAHGGIIATVLDEVMAWSLVGEDSWGMTARMSIDFKRPVPIGARIRADGRIVGVRRRLVDTSAQLLDASQGVLATATGTYVAAPENRKRELQKRYGFRFTADAESGTPDRVDRGSTDGRGGGRNPEPVPARRGTAR